MPAYAPVLGCYMPRAHQYENIHDHQINNQIVAEH